ncbi:N-acyl homoserine lactonase family protein [Pelagerythrobacter aerophilus]|uniref:N-acyl homoserine lactonase family protein n=1 Tax=Pelagerythrobacter aerophilus TaxID=2306995 RepID=A0A418NDW4_9SPHN|nr:N-acyl homoserine lactonase family protein [Pelagerythrobacter aerophilus]RIV75434.1 N-acyl homoserine lactonase family protein [Pelagerythrobacter aerophilus]
MKHILAVALACTSIAATAAEPAPDVSLTRLDCGRATEPWPLDSFDDTGGADGMKKAIVGSCYLIRHGERLMIWDTGIDPATSGDPDGGFFLDRTLVDQLAQLGIAPADIEFVGVSHYHYDHTGQAKDFPQATLLIGKEDWQAITHDPPLGNANPAHFPAWVSGQAKVEAFSGDKDVFGDRSVRILATPGHTPGHHSLLVRLPETGPVLLTGDVAHFTANYEREGVPTYNTNRADTLASFDRVKKMAKNLGVKVIIQHEPADVAKLPAFPEAAR